MVKLSEVRDEHFEEVSRPPTSEFEGQDDDDDDFEDYESGEEEELSDGGQTENTTASAAPSSTMDPAGARRRRGIRRTTGGGVSGGKAKRKAGGGRSMRERLESDSYWANLGGRGGSSRRNKVVEDDGEEDSSSDEDEDDDADLFEETLAQRIAALKDIVPVSYRAKIKGCFGTIWGVGSWSARVGGKIAFVLSTSALLVGVPYALAVTEEQGLLEMEKEMKLQQQANELISTAAAPLGGQQQQPAGSPRFGDSGWKV